MTINFGQVLEHVVRRDRMGISELSRKLNVSRRTVYNWFNQINLNPEIILKVGAVIGHDFSLELPDTFSKNLDIVNESYDMYNGSDAPIDIKSVYFWMNKYITLLEKYNDILSNSSDEGKESESLLNSSNLRSSLKGLSSYPFEK